MILSSSSSSPTADAGTGVWTGILSTTLVTATGIGLAAGLGAVGTEAVAGFIFQGFYLIAFKIIVT
jgi:hypothetical protein